MCHQRRFHRCCLEWYTYERVPILCSTYTYMYVNLAMVLVRLHVRIHVLYEIIRIRTITLWIRTSYLYWLYDIAVYVDISTNTMLYVLLHIRNFGNTTTYLSVEIYEFSRLPGEFVFFIHAYVDISTNTILYVLLHVRNFGNMTTYLSVEIYEFSQLPGEFVFSYVDLSTNTVLYVSVHLCKNGIQVGTYLHTYPCTGSKCTYLYYYYVDSYYLVLLIV